MLAVVDAREPDAAAALSAELADAPRVLWLHNKADLLEPARIPPNTHDHLWLSARSGLQQDALRLRLRDVAGVGEADGAFSARARHVDALRRVGMHLESAACRLRIERAGELAAEELRLAQVVLGEITGSTTSDDLLGAIFSSFCIGK